MSLACLALNLVPLVLANVHCYHPSRPYPAPILQANDPRLISSFKDLEKELHNGLQDSNPHFNLSTTSFAVEITSTDETLWGQYHTAPLLGNYTDSEPIPVTSNTAFRIASISKVFTVLAALLEEKAGRLSLRDPVTKHVPELTNNGNDGGIMWETITLESLASQLSGIPREYGQDDLTDQLADQDWGFDDPIAFGLPPVFDSDTAQCGTNRQTARPCTRKELLEGFKDKPQIFTPNSKATYSNVAFILLGIVLENITGKPYEDIVYSHILQPLGMRHSTLKKPRDSDGVIPAMKNDWGSDLGAYDPTGGLYSSTSDLAILLRAILTQKLIDTPTTNAWLKPHSFSSSADFAYGMPWEIFRTDSLLPNSDRNIDLFIKAGGLSGYTSRIILIPEYNLGVTVLVAGDGKALGWLEEVLLKKLIPGVDSMAKYQTRETYADTYQAPASLGINSSISFEVDDAFGLVVTSWISNDTDFLYHYKEVLKGTTAGRVQIVPSNIQRGTTGEVWRIISVAPDLRQGLFIEGCLLDDLDSMMYGGRSLEEIVFHRNTNGVVESVELPAFRITLEKGKPRTTKNWYGAMLLGSMKPLGLFKI